jgi:hypothetical protein
MAYIHGEGKFQAESDALFKLLPREGKVYKNPTLERYRIACNNYYDIFNNGGCNRGRSIGKMFPGVMGHINERYRFRSVPDWDAILMQVDPIMDKIIEAAAKKNL